MVRDAEGRLGTVRDAKGRWTLWDARGTQGGRCSIERGRDGDATVTGRSRSRHKNVRIAVLKMSKVFFLGMKLIRKENQSSM